MLFDVSKPITTLSFCRLNDPQANAKHLHGSILLKYKIKLLLTQFSVNLTLNQAHSKSGNIGILEGAKFRELIAQYSSFYHRSRERQLTLSAHPARRTPGLNTSILFLYNILTTSFIFVENTRLLIKII